MSTVNEYTITVKNNSGAQQRYALFNKAPIIIGRVQGQIWSNVFATAPTAVNQQAKFSIFTQYYAMCGSSQGSMADGVEVDVSGTKPVTLGSTTTSGTAVLGSSVDLAVVDNAPQFSPTLLANNGEVDAFEFVTGTDFTVAEAQTNNYIIGLGGSKTGKTASPAATFMPEPNVHYQIMPANTYFLTFGDYKQGVLIDVTKVGAMATIDFTQLPTDVTVVHDAHGNLDIQSA